MTHESSSLLVGCFCGCQHHSRKEGTSECSPDTNGGPGVWLGVVVFLLHTCRQGHDSRVLWRDTRTTGMTGFAALYCNNNNIPSGKKPFARVL